jgi:tetratricopeptide (TPR) repeat protein
MPKRSFVLISLAFVCISGLAQGTPDGDFHLALPAHQGQLQLAAKGFKIIESSAKPNGYEIGIRGKDDFGRLAFLAFLFLVPEQAPLTSAKCRDFVLAPQKKRNPTLKILGVQEVAQPGAPSVSVVSYTAKDRSGKSWYNVRAFVATADICGDLEFYSDQPISAGDTDLKMILSTYRLDEKYVPTFNDIFVYAQILYNAHMYKPAAPMFELALEKLRKTPESSNKTTMGRVATDQAGMAYGISGDIAKARAIFEKAITEDPDYPMYYYNLACADAEEKNLVGAQKHLREAFARKANVIPGERLPDPTKDDSFVPYRNNKEFWSFLNSLQGKE